MVAENKLLRLLEILRENVSDLKRYSNQLQPGEIGRSRDRQHMVLHAMYVATQAMIDSANHVLADRGLPRALSYAAIFDRLAEAGVLEKPLAERLGDWASMRNVLAHFYPVVDFDKVERALKEDWRF